MKRRHVLASGLLGALHLAAPALLTGNQASAQQLRGGRPLRVGLLADITNFDPQSFSSVNFPLIKNLYDSLLEYTPEG